MKKKAIGLILLLSITAGCAGNQHAKAQLKQGSNAPDFTADEQTGGTLTLSKLTAKGPVVLTLLRGFY